MADAARRRERLKNDPEYAEKVKERRFVRYWEDAERRREKQRRLYYTSRGLPVPENKKVYKLRRAEPTIIIQKEPVVVEKRVVVEKPVVVEKVVVVKKPVQPAKEKKTYTDRPMRLIVATPSALTAPNPTPVIEEKVEPPAAFFLMGGDAWS